MQCSGKYLGKGVRSERRRGWSAATTFNLMPNCLIVQHVEPEPAFSIADALNTAKVDMEICRVFVGDRLPESISGFDGLVVMGGPMSATSDDDFPTRRQEIALLAGGLSAGIPVLGVCLGAQLLAVAGGASVFLGDVGPEIGWTPVELLPAARDDLLFGGLPRRLTVLHWHNETFELPDGAQHLAGNGAYINQAFRIGGAAWGLQFHLEVTEAGVEGFLREFEAESQLAAGGPGAVRSITPSAIADLAASRDLVFDRFAALVATRIDIEVSSAGGSLQQI